MKFLIILILTNRLCSQDASSFEYLNKNRHLNDITFSVSYATFYKNAVLLSPQFRTYKKDPRIHGVFMEILYGSVHEGIQKMRNYFTFGPIVKIFHEEKEPIRFSFDILPGFGMASVLQKAIHDIGVDSNGVSLGKKEGATAFLEIKPRIEIKINFNESFGLTFNADIFYLHTLPVLNQGRLQKYSSAFGAGIFFEDI